VTQENDYVPPPPPPQPGAYDQTNVPPAPPPPGVPMGYEAPPTAVVETNPEAKTWGMLAHLSALSGLIIPFGHFLGPLIVWLLKKEQMPFVNDQGKEAMNFQITITIALLVAGLTICIGIGIILMPIVGIVGLVFSIIAAIKANEGIAYRYPFTLRLIK
jgi:uncharacterized protein